MQLYCLWFGMLTLSYCGLKRIKTWRSYNISRKGIPLENGQGKGGIFLGILSSMGVEMSLSYTSKAYSWAVNNRVGVRPQSHEQFCKRDGPLKVHLQFNHILLPNNHIASGLDHKFSQH